MNCKQLIETLRQMDENTPVVVAVNDEAIELESIEIADIAYLRPHRRNDSLSYEDRKEPVIFVGNIKYLTYK